MARRNTNSCPHLEYGNDIVSPVKEDFEKLGGIVLDGIPTYYSTTCMWGYLISKEIYITNLKCV